MAWQNFNANTATSVSTANPYHARRQGEAIGKNHDNAGFSPISDFVLFTPRSTIHNGDCTRLMAGMSPNSVDFILTDPPYITRYRGRDGRTVANDDNARWLKPAFAEMHRILKPGSFCVSFYGWNKVDLFFDAWREAGFRIVGHLVFRKRYASSAKFLRYQHEQAFLLGKAAVVPPTNAISDVIDFPYTGNKLHPTQKPIEALIPLIEVFSKPGDLVLDPFCGSGSTLVAAKSLGRDWLGIELDREYHTTATARLNGNHDSGRASA